MIENLISIREVLYLLLMSAVIGYIFMGLVRRKPKDYLSLKRFDWEDYKFAVLVAAPGIVLHELAHKFVAMGFGLSAVFEIWPTGLAIGAILKAVGSGFILLAPGYVTIPLTATPFQIFLTALAGPLVNLGLWLGAGYMLKMPNLPRSRVLFLVLMKQINKWLFIFNMLPIPPLDGSKVLFNLIKLI